MSNSVLLPLALDRVTSVGQNSDSRKIPATCIQQTFKNILVTNLREQQRDTLSVMNNSFFGMMLLTDIRLPVIQETIY